jgi:hypothetical protein
VAGRLRWIAAHATRRDDRRLEDLLDPSFAPRRSWATELGQDPEAKRKKHEKRRLLQGRPRPGAAPDRAALVAWIRSAFEVLEDTRIAALLMGFAPVVLALDVADLPGAERRERRRLRKVQSLLSEIDPSAAERMAAEDAADVEAPEPEADDGALDDWDDPAERLLELVKRRTVGRTALVISNRKDPLLEQTLRDTFGFSELAWCEGSPRRVQTMSERVAAGTYDFVLSATGFQSHSVDAHMVRACRRAQAFYVRVHRGRRLACILALAREMGLGEDEDAPARSAAAG